MAIYNRPAKTQFGKKETVNIRAVNLQHIIDRVTTEN